MDHNVHESVKHECTCSAKTSGVLCPVHGKYQVDINTGALLHQYLKDKPHDELAAKAVHNQLTRARPEMFSALPDKQIEFKTNGNLYALESAVEHQIKELYKTAPLDQIGLLHRLFFKYKTLVNESKS